MSSSDMLKNICQSVIDGNESDAKKFAEQALEDGLDPMQAIKGGLMKGMEVVGEKFQNYEIFLSQMMMSAEAFKTAMAVLKPRISQEERAKTKIGTVVIGTVTGDIHDIGKTLVSLMLSVAGFDVHDIGVDAPSKNFIEKAKEVNADIIALSCLMTPSMPYQRDVMILLKDMGIRDKYFVIVGGGPVSSEWAKEIGADGYGRFPEDAVALVKSLMNKKQKGGC